MARSKRTITVNPQYFIDQISRNVSEHELQGWVVDLAERTGWEWRHAKDSRRQDLNGLPDLILWNVEQRTLIWVELKREVKKLTVDHLNKRSGTFVQGQTETIEALQACGQVVYVWRPSDWHAGTIDVVLKAGRED